MYDPTLLPPSHLGPSRRGLRTTSQSPSRSRPTDDLISRLSPRSAVDALSNPSGALKACLDAATPSETSFAMRTAHASMKIHEWLQELLQWPWPRNGPSAGFQSPQLDRRKGEEPLPSPGSASSANEGGETLLGSLTKNAVGQYETRIDEIHTDMDDMDVEGIKAQVLHSHILPLSRPGTPLSESGRSTTSTTMSSYNKMDDLTALVTAVVLQALPNLNKLTRLMNVWSARILVLRRSPAFHQALDEAETALASGWRTVDQSMGELGGQSEGKGVSPSSLSRGDFDVMRRVLGQKISRCGREIDAMLDALEGADDTIPDEWIDRLEALEGAYGEWVATCERIIRDAEWAMRQQASRDTRSAEAAAKADQDSKPEKPSSHDTIGLADSGIALIHETPELRSDDTTVTSNGLPEQANVLGVDRQAQDSREDGQKQDSSTPRSETIESAKLPSNMDGQVHSDVDLITPKPSTMKLNGTALELQSMADGRNGHGKVENRTVQPNPRRSLNALQSVELLAKRRGFVADDLAFEDGEDVLPLDLATDEAEEPELPPAAPAIEEDQSVQKALYTPLLEEYADGFSSDPPVFGTPDPLRSHPVFTIDHAGLRSPSSSPPDFRLSTRSQAMAYVEMPTVSEDLEARSPSETQLENLRIEEVESPGPASTSGKTSGANSDDQLQQQISEILESIPARIRLATEPTAINLNPPDLKLPKIRSRPDPFPRSRTSMSSRAATPSFTLAPAVGKGPRPRMQRGNQDIKVYHLSRSTGEPPIKLLIRLVGDNGERVMVRVGGGWADLGEYLKEYAAHHTRRSGGDSKVEIKDVLRGSGLNPGSSPPSRPASALDSYSPITPLAVRKTRRSFIGTADDDSRKQPQTPLTTANARSGETPLSEISTRSRSSSRLSWTEEDSSLGMAGPRARNVEMSEESKAWVESVKEKVRLASGERKVSDHSAADGKFGDMGKVGGTKRLFRKKG